VQEAIIKGYPDADISVSIVWINMLPLDNRAMAHVRAQTMQDPRVHHFHDPRKRVGQAIAHSMGGRDEVAWDIYIFFAPGGEWMAARRRRPGGHINCPARVGPTRRTTITAMTWSDSFARPWPVCCADGLSGRKQQ